MDDEKQIRWVGFAYDDLPSRPRVSDVVNQKTDKFTIDTLVGMLSRAGKPVKLAIS